MNTEFNKINKFLWAKKNDKNGVYKWLPLRVHLEDTRQVIGLLWEHWLSEGQKNYINESIKDNGENYGKKISMFLGACHDIGKSSPVFQTSISYTGKNDFDNLLVERLENDGFANLSNFTDAFRNKSHHTIIGQTLLDFYGVGEDISAIIGAHHGKPINYLKEVRDQVDSYLYNYFQSSDKKNSTYIKWEREQKIIFDWALNSSGFNSVADLPKIPKPTSVILSGLLIMADWISSNEDYFPLFDIDTYEVCDSNSRIENAWSKWWTSDKLQINNISNYLDIYKKRFNFASANEVQKVFSETILDCKNPGIFILEAPMGIGKTEAALSGVEELIYKKELSGLFFGLPTQATSNGMFKRVEDWLNSLAEENNERLSIHLVHGKAALNEDFAKLSQNIDQDSPESGGALTVNQWFSGRKKTSLDDFVIGTCDQFLLVSLKQKHLALRHLGFSGKVVVLDEVHAYDCYMSNYLYMSLEWMGAYNIPVIILSATLPIERRIEMLRAYMRGRGLKWRKVNKINDLESSAYPSIIYSDGDTIKVKNRFKKLSDKKVKIIRENKDNLVNLLIDLYKNKGVIGVILNTVRQAQELAKICKEKFGEDSCYLLHSNFIATDRAQKERELLNLVGKNAKRPYRKIIIGTQVIEQSLDLDFDVLISDICPMDLLIQRIGRLHRHDIERDSYYKVPKAYVLGCNKDYDFDDATKAVYSPYILMRSQYFLPEEILIPTDISPLVQKVYADEKISLDETLMSFYEKYKIEFEVKVGRTNNKASVYKLEDPGYSEDEKYTESLVGWLKDIDISLTEEKAYARVRDINDTIEVIALKKIGEGYGSFIDNIDISREIESPKIGKEIAKQTLRLPLVLSMYGNFDKTIKELEDYNRKFLKCWQDQRWLKGSLGLIFDENNTALLNNYRLTYKRDVGLIYQKEG